MLGIGAMVGLIGGNTQTVQAIEQSLGKEIKDFILNLDAGDGQVEITFTDNSKLIIADEGRSCCESRYICTDDLLPTFIGQKLLNVELKEGPKAEGYAVHETQFLDIITSLGKASFVTHNEHNGYYGGFSVCAKLELTKLTGKDIN